MSDPELVDEILSQILEAASRIERRCTAIKIRMIFLQVKTGLINWTESV